MPNNAKSPDNVEFIQLALAGFSFPEDLDNDKANFRFVVDVRYIDDKGKLATHHAVMPSPDTYWECDTDKSGSPNYVRSGQTLHSFDMNRIDPWDRLVFLGRAKIHSVQVKVFDVDRQDFWDKIADALSGLIGAWFGKARALVPSGTNKSPASAASDVFGSYVDDVSSSVLKKLANGDKVLFRGSWSNAQQSEDLSDDNTGPMAIEGRGTRGVYRVTMQQSSASIP